MMRLRAVALCAVVSVLISVGALGSDGGTTVGEIVQRWAAANRADFEGSLPYNYSERIRDKDGTKTYEVAMLFGRPYKRLMMINGTPLGQSERQQEENKFIQERADRAAESRSERADRMAEYQKKRERAHRILDEIPQAFRYTRRPNRRVGSLLLYVLRASPRPGYEPPNIEAKVLTGMRGEFWIDTTTYQLYRGVAYVLRPISIEGFLATIQPGTQFEVEQRPVGDGIWLPTHVTISSRSSIVFLFHHHTDEERDYFDYRKVSEF
jgi:hypothetical protein